MNPDSDEAFILDNMIHESFDIIQSDYLIDEVVQWFRRKKGRSNSSKVWHYLDTIPNPILISKYEWGAYVDSVREKVVDVDDIPHICAYILMDCDYFITENRRLTQMSVSDMVNFISAEDIRKVMVDYLQVEN